MKNFNISLKNMAVLIVILAVTVFISCEKDDGGTDDPVVTMQNVALAGTVRDTGGNPLNSVTVTTGTDGIFAIKQAVIRFEKADYFTLICLGIKTDEIQIKSVMQPKGNSASNLKTSFNASEVKNLSVNTYITTVLLTMVNSFLCVGTAKI